MSKKRTEIAVVGPRYINHFDHVTPKRSDGWYGSDTKVTAAVHNKYLLPLNQHLVAIIEVYPSGRMIVRMEYKGKIE